MNYIDDDNGNDNRGNKGKFSDRLKKMRRDRLRIKKYGKSNDDNINLKDVGRNILKVFLAVPSIVYNNVVDNDKKNDDKSVIKDDFNGEIDKDSSLKMNSGSKRYKVNMIKKMNVSLLKKNIVNNKLYTVNNEKEIDKLKLQREIINLIKKKLVKNINELEVLNSELYILNQLELGDIYLDECKKDIKEIKKLLSKINTLKEKYDYLKENIDFEYMLEYEDEFIIDKILELKSILTSDEIRKTVDDYKILDEYKYLYLKIDKMQENVIKYEEYKNNKVKELKQRDIDFDELKGQVYNIDVEKERYDSFIKDQERILKDLNDNINKIDSYEEVNYKLKGFSQLLNNSFKYLGLLLVNPLKGLIPGIATQTLITKNIIGNLYKNLEWEENRRMVYDAINYSDLIEKTINNLDDTSLMIDSTLEDISLLKNKYKKEFSKYEKSFSEYDHVIKKLNKIENSILGNKIKLEYTKDKMKEKEKENKNKMKLVKKMNDVNN